MPSHKTGLLIIRAHVEAEERLRISVQVSEDVSHGVDRTVNLSDQAALIELVQSWLAEMTG